MKQIKFRAFNKIKKEMINNETLEDYTNRKISEADQNRTRLIKTGKFDNLITRSTDFKIDYVKMLANDFYSK